MKINHQIMTEENKAGEKYIPDFDLLRNQASCEEERQYIDRVEDSIKTSPISNGFAWNMVYVQRMACGHFEIFQTPARTQEEADLHLGYAAKEAKIRKCTRCICGF